jgi:hypothetical protein
MGFKPGNQTAFVQISSELKNPFTSNQKDQQFWLVDLSEWDIDIGASPKDPQNRPRLPNAPQI